MGTPDDCMRMRCLYDEVGIAIMLIRRGLGDLSKCDYTVCEYFVALLHFCGTHGRDSWRSLRNK